MSSPGITWYSAPLLVLVGERVHTGTQPLALALVHGVQHVENLIAPYVQRAAVQLTRDVQIETDVEGVSRHHCPIFNILQEPPVAWK